MSPITKRRLFGIDRSGPSPPQTLAGQPLRPWTLPNAIEFVRLAGIPVFLAVALSSHKGHDALAVVLFAVIGWTDYVDGFVARLTGQYSRLGALLDPVVDRVACDLRNGRRLEVLAASPVGDWCRRRPRGADARAEPLRPAARGRAEDQLGRPARRRADMGAPFFAMADVHWLALVMLYVGMALVPAGNRAVRSARGHRVARAGTSLRKASS